MNGYVTGERFQTIYDMPIQLPQMELRRGRYIIAGTIKIGLGQVMRIRCFNLHLVALLTPDDTPDIFNTPLGIVSAGIYNSPMVCSSGVLLHTLSPGVVGFNSFQYRDYATPGTYSFIVSNNSRNVDLSVSMTGVAKIING